MFSFIYAIIANYVFCGIDFGTTASCVYSFTTVDWVLWALIEVPLALVLLVMLVKKFEERRLLKTTK